MVRWSLSGRWGALAAAIVLVLAGCGSAPPDSTGNTGDRSHQVEQSVPQPAGPENETTVSPTNMAGPAGGVAELSTQMDLPSGGANLSQSRLNHIIARHWPDSPTANAGHFAPGITDQRLRAMIDDAVNNGSARPNTAGRPGTLFERDLGRVIGTNSAGNATRRLRVVVDPSSNVITAFPY